MSCHICKAGNTDSGDCGCSCGKAMDHHCHCHPVPTSCSCQESSCEPPLGKICGTSIHLDDIEFATPGSSLVYMDKIFSYNKAASCPILFHLDTGRSPIGTFNTDLELSAPISRQCSGCEDTESSCGCCTLTPDAVFHVEGGSASLDYIGICPPESLEADQITVDGCEADSVSYLNGQYTVSLSSVLSRIQKSRCSSKGLPTKHFFLLRDVGPWEIRGIFDLYGIVNTGGKTCRFRAAFKLEDHAPNICVPSSCPSGFAIPDLALPCAVNGTAPEVHLQFGGKLKMVNPEICICPRISEPGPGPDSDSENSCGCSYGFPRFSPVLVTQLVLEPSVHAESIRKTLFCVNACEGRIPCGSTASDLSIESDEYSDPYAPDCSCNACCSCCPTSSPESCDKSRPAAVSCSGSPSPESRRSVCRPTSDAYQYNGCNGCTW